MTATVEHCRPALAGGIFVHPPGTPELGNALLPAVLLVLKNYGFSPTATTISQGPTKPFSDSNF
jgi:hypothetical protein